MGLSRVKSNVKRNRAQARRSRPGSSKRRAAEAAVEPPPGPGPTVPVPVGDFRPTKTQTGASTPGSEPAPLLPGRRGSGNQKQGPRHNLLVCVCSPTTRTKPPASCPVRNAGWGRGWVGFGLAQGRERPQRSGPASHGGHGERGCIAGRADVTPIWSPAFITTEGGREGGRARS